jgi:hypothetical protein
MDDQTGRLLGDKRVEYIHSRRKNAYLGCEIVVTLRDAAATLQKRFYPDNPDHSFAHIPALTKLFHSKGQELRELGVDWPWDESPRGMLIEPSFDFVLIGVAMEQPRLFMYLGPSYLEEEIKNKNENISTNDFCRNHDHVSLNYDDNDRNEYPPGVDFFFYSADTWDKAWDQAKNYRRISTIEFGNGFNIEK